MKGILVFIWVSITVAAVYYFLAAIYRYVREAKAQPKDP